MERTDEGTNERTDEQMSARTYKRHNEGTNERTNRRTEGRKKGRTDESFQAKITCAHCIATAPTPDLALTSSISVPAEPNLWYSTKHYRKRKLEAEQAGEFRGQYNKKLPYRSCNRRILPTEVQARSAGARCTGTISTICDCSRP
ncbi:hypothetical protein DPMN_160324 [Dreissena polymorpha]|uniref:Uncharacterized protein n=1 Tax=Dreissena polymorpha TaxID=45954 RepID=A0A9D4EKK7_DREPO|nr:hypothetical protein DPMN_160324 [Dreissena polymorpha]